MLHICPRNEGINDMCDITVMAVGEFIIVRYLYALVSGVNEQGPVISLAALQDHNTGSDSSSKE